MERIRVFLADSQALYREGMRMALSKEGDIEVIGEADDGEEALYQTLIPMANGPGRIVAVEVMIATDAIRNLIREAKTPRW